MVEFVNFSMSALDQVPLAEIAIKATLVVALAAVACLLLCRRSAAMRHRIWVLGVAASLIVPLATCLLPRMPLPILPSSLERVSQLAFAKLTPPSPTVVQAPREPLATSEALESKITPPSETLPSELQQVTSSSEGWEQAAVRATGSEAFFVLMWFAGSVLSLALFLRSVARQSRWMRELPTVDDADWEHSVATAARALGMRGTIATLESDRTCVPAVVGVLRLRLVIPGSWRSWSPPQRQCILLHELAHIRRRDVATQLLGRLACIVYWFNPLMWHAARQMRIERELASDDCVLLAGQAASDYAEQLLRTLRSYRPMQVVLGVAMAHSARLDERIRAILDPRRQRRPVGYRLAAVLTGLVAIFSALLGGLTLSQGDALAMQPDKPTDTPPRIWVENYTIEYPGALPVSVAFSADGQLLLSGDTSGEVMALVFRDDRPLWRWKTSVGGSHAAVAVSADQKRVYATTKDGVRALDITSGEEIQNIPAPNSRPTAIGVFPDKPVADDVLRAQIAFGNPRGYFVKSWVAGRLADSLGTIEVHTVADGTEPVDPSAVPLAVDPRGRSAIMTGPIDATGASGGVKGKNVLWAYVCGDHEPGSPGNRVLVGHEATVVSAAWAKAGHAAVTGDTAGRVIVWDADTMKERRRLELGGRVMALALSDDGSLTAAWVGRGNGCEAFVWDTKSDAPKEPIHAELADFQGSAVHASLAFSPDGQRLAGCAINKSWLSRLGELIGKVHVWEVAAELAIPRHQYTRALPKASASRVVLLNNHAMLLPSAKDGAVDMRDLADGKLLFRLVLGEFRILNTQRSADRKWLAMEQQPLVPANPADIPSVDVAVYDAMLSHKCTIPDCRQLLDIAPGGEEVAVLRGDKIEIWNVPTARMVHAAPFPFRRLDAAAFSPDGRWLAISDRNELVLWHWPRNHHERIPLGRTVGALAFSPDGKFLAEGPAPREDISWRRLATRTVERTFANDDQRAMNVPRLVYSHGGRILIGCDNLTFNENVVVPHRLHLWNTQTGDIAHQIAAPAGLPIDLDVSPNGRYLVALLDEGEAGIKLSAWRLDGKEPAAKSGPQPPAVERPR